VLDKRRLRAVLSFAALSGEVHRVGRPVCGLITLLRNGNRG
jgi:hypothetical protein